jgi:hypothetical protein
MIDPITYQIDWFTSQEVLKTLKIKSCDLMHLRKHVKLDFKKKEMFFCIQKQAF